MPLQHIQLRPKKNPSVPALQRQLQERSPQPGGTRYGGELPKPYAGPTITPIDRGMNRTPSATSAPLLQALNGPAPDIQGEAWARREEIVAANQAKLDAEADALYQSVQGLSPEDQKYMLDKVVTKGSSSALASALGAEPGSISPAAIRTDPLMKTMMDKNYIKKTATGYDWMLPEKEKKLTSQRVDSYSGEIVNVYADGTELRTGNFEKLPEEKPTSADLLNEEKLAQLKKSFGNQYVLDAMDMLGAPPVAGEPQRDKEGKVVFIATQQDVDNYWMSVVETVNSRKNLENGKVNMDWMQRLYKTPEDISRFQQMAGVETTGFWDEATIEAAEKMFGGGM